MSGMYLELVSRDGLKTCYYREEHPKLEQDKFGSWKLSVPNINGRFIINKSIPKYMSSYITRG